MATTDTPDAISANDSAPKARAISIAILAMGGEGGGVLADWIVAMAEGSGYYAQTTSVPGVAQRTGATIYYVELFPESAVRAAGKEPVLALMPVPGEVDLVIASELMEAGRAIQRGLVTPNRTTFIASDHRVYSMTEKIALGEGRVDSEAILAGCQSAAKRFVHGDFARIAEEAGSVISAALFGALAGAGALPFKPVQFEGAIRQGGVGVESSLAAFAAGFDAASVSGTEVKPASVPAPEVGPRLQVLATRIATNFPREGHDILLAGISRLADYQDERYAAEYLDQLESVRDLDTQHGDDRFALLRETGRYLALWMSYEDASRVADLKIRSSRFQRVHNEVKAKQAQLVQINEYLHPGPQEIADVLPTPIGRWLLNSRLARWLINDLTGKGSIVETTSLTGFLLMYIVAGQRLWRRKSLRYQEEKRKINAWLEKVRSTAPTEYPLALEVAECANLIKGYGDTRVRGSRNFDAVIGAIPALLRRSDPAAGLKELREAALADESGEKLAEALREVGA